MQTTQIRDIVSDKINGIRDKNYLMALKTILDMRQTNEDVYPLNETQKYLIRQGKEQIAGGEYISDQDLQKEEDEWLNT